MSDFNCLVCGTAHAQGDSALEPMGFHCSRCGRYALGIRFAAFLNRAPQEAEFVRLRPYLSAHLRQASERGEIVQLSHDNWETFAEGHAHTPVARKLDLLLKLFSLRSGTVGSAVVLNADDFVLVDAASGAELNYLSEALRQQELIQGGTGLYTVTPKGWERLSPADPGGIPGTCFVAMAFDVSLNEVYDVAIEPAVRATGLSVIRVDKVEHNGIVTDLIHAEIRRAQVVVADVTLQRPGVYFEAGLAIGLGRAVIWCCREDEITKVHFDTRQYSHVVWKDAADLRMKLETRIRGTMSIILHCAGP